MSVQIFDCEQGSDEWRQVRCGLPTASEFSAILAKGEGKTRMAYMRRLAGEIITGQPIESYSNPYMDRGKAQEYQARDLYGFVHDAPLTQVGFIKNGDKGCSPDSLIGSNGVLEIKTQRCDLMIETLLKDTFPSEHRAQCQGALWVTERDFVDLVVYAPRMPLFVKRATRDEKYIAELAGEVDRFNDELRAMVLKLKRYGLERAA